MPIVSSEITEDSPQADSRRWVSEKHIAGTGQVLTVSYLALSGANIESSMLARVPGLDQSLIDVEISRYLNRIEQGLGITGLPYAETTPQERFFSYVVWLKANVQERNFEKVQWAYLYTDPYTEQQINDFLVGTIFEGKADVIKLWTAKIKDMQISMQDVEDTVEGT